MSIWFVPFFLVTAIAAFFLFIIVLVDMADADIYKITYKLYLVGLLFVYSIFATIRIL